MPKKQFSKRQLQVGENIRRLVAMEINKLDIMVESDFLTIVRAEISKDLRYCKIFYRCKVLNKDIYLKFLEQAKNDLTNTLYKQLQLRLRPEVRFVFDDTMAIIEEIERVVERNKVVVE